MMTKVVLLAVGGRKFSLPVEQIKHVLSVPQLFPLVCLRQEIAGVFMYNDEPVPVLALSKLPELHFQETVTGNAYVVLVQSEYGNVGLPVDSAVTIVNAEDGLIEEILLSEEEQGGHLFIFQGARYPILDIDGILARLQY